MSKMEYLYDLKYLAELKLHQRKSKEELSEIQSKKLRKMIRHAYNNVPFYRELFDREKIDPDSIRKIEDLQKIPIITKRDIQANYDKIIAKGTNINECSFTTTTGSTGIPLKVYKDKKALYYSSALVHFAFFESGLRLRDRFVELSNTPIVENKKTVLNRNMISLYDPPKQITEKLRQYNPDVIYSFPSIFKTISRFLDDGLDNGLKLSPRLVFTHGETLTASSRENIRSTFNTDVYNTYGSTEFNRLAFECSEHSGYHMITDCAIVEIVKDGQCVSPGEEGEIIVTGLYNEAMPFIRYKLGDIGIMADYDCACGRGWPLIKSIEGRSDDFITLPSGKQISARIINVIEDVPGIIQYRTIQERRDKFVVQVVAGKDFTSDSERQIGEKIRSGCFGEYVNVDVELVDELQRERTGKLRAIVSNV